MTHALAEALYVTHFDQHQCIIWNISKKRVLYAARKLIRNYQFLIMILVIWLNG